jgi:hypothetical protein
VGDLEVEGEPCDEHICLQADLVDAGRRQGDGQADEAEDGDGTLLSLGPQLDNLHCSEVRWCSGVCFNRVHDIH